MQEKTVSLLGDYDDIGLGLGATVVAKLAESLPLQDESGSNYPYTPYNIVMTVFSHPLVCYVTFGK